MTISIIAAMTDEGVIGKDGQLPWYLPEDLKRFKDVTLGHPIVMGRKTFESIGRVLPGRQNIVVTRDKSYRVVGATVVHDIEAAFEKAQTKGEIFVIGGAEIYKAALPAAQRLYLTVIHEPFEGDTFFPEFSLSDDFQIIEQTENRSIEGLAYSLLIAERPLKS